MPFGQLNGFAWLVWKFLYLWHGREFDIDTNAGKFTQQHQYRIGTLAIVVASSQHIFKPDLLADNVMHKVAHKSIINFVVVQENVRHACIEWFPFVFVMYRTVIYIFVSIHAPQKVGQFVQQRYQRFKRFEVAFKQGRRKLAIYLRKVKMKVFMSKSMSDCVKETICHGFAFSTHVESNCVPIFVAAVSSRPILQLFLYQTYDVRFESLWLYENDVFQSMVDQVLLVASLPKAVFVHFPTSLVPYLWC